MSYVLWDNSGKFQCDKCTERATVELNNTEGAHTRLCKQHFHEKLYPLEVE